MKKIILLLCAAITVIASFDGCKKYSDGPRISLRSKEHRIEGNWNITSYKIDGQEYVNTVETTSDSYYSYYCSTDYSYDLTVKITSMKLNISKGAWIETEETSYTDIDVNATEVNCVLTMATTTESTSDGGSWTWSSNKKQFVINDTWGSAPQIYDILELKEKEMKLRMIDSGSVIEMTLTQ